MCLLLANRLRVLTRIVDSRKMRHDNGDRAYSVLIYTTTHIPRSPLLYCSLLTKL